jgi:hypothetical protein
MATNGNHYQGKKNDMQKKYEACGEFKSKLPIVF